jgi:hypothetical protein
MLAEADYIPEPNTGCWLWLGNVDSGGYPQRTIYTRGAGTYRCVRIAREVIGARPYEVACHRCDVPLCVNPDHLYRGTWKSNMEDKVRRGRWRGGRKKGGKNYG